MKIQVKKLWLLALLCLYFSNLKAQYIVNGHEVDTSFNHQMNFVFGSLEANRIPYGILKDYGMQFTNLSGYDGSNMADSTLLNKTLFYEIYNTLLSSRLTAAAYSTLQGTNITDSVWYSNRVPGQVALCGLFYQYAYLDPNALNTNKITLSGDQFFDKYTSGVWQNPYIISKAVGFAAATDSYLGQSFNILLPDNLWLSNSKSIVNHIEIDAGDGLGYRTLTPDTPLPVSYADTGLKVWNFKLYLSDNSILQSHTNIQVNADVYGQNVVDNQYRTLSNMGTNSTTNITNGTFPFSSTETYNGYPGRGFVTVALAPGHSTIQKPLIIVEGFDPGRYTKPESNVGSSSLKDFGDNVATSPDLMALLIGPAQVYDLIYIDYYNGTDDIHRNALLVKEVIRWVNSVKQPLAGNSTNEKNVIIGQSMGGLIARYVLKKMEDNNETHDTRLYINHDGPMQGANVPVGYQHLVNHVQNLYIRYGTLLAGGYEVVKFLVNSPPQPPGAPAGPTLGDNPIPGLLSIRNTPAARQLLINYIDEGGNLDNSMHNAWQTELTNLGYPSQNNIRNVAISNGSECGETQETQTGGVMLAIDGQFKTSLLGQLTGGVSFVGSLMNEPKLVIVGLLPGTDKITTHLQVNASSATGGNQVYSGNIHYSKSFWGHTYYNTDLTNMVKSSPSGLGIENFPGSFVHVDPLGSPSADTWFYDYHTTVAGPYNFCFVAVPSVLDLGGSPSVLSQPDYVRAYGALSPPLSPKNTPFANFISGRNQSTGVAHNEQHISFNTRNGQWLANELDQKTTAAYNYNIFDCSLGCITNGTISGPSHFCGSTIAQYSISGLPTNANVTWTVDGNTSFVGPATGSQVSLTTGVAYGAQDYPTITATVHSTCGNITIVKHIITGIQNLPEITGPAEICIMTHGNRYDVEAPEASSPYYTWTLSPNPPDFTTYSGPQLNLRTFYAGTYWLQVVVPTLCGPEQQGMWLTVNECLDGGPMFLAYPNPASQTMTITSEATPTNQTTAAKTTGGTVNSTTLAKAVKKPFQYKVYDGKGKIWAQGESVAGADIAVNVASIPNNTYFLHIIAGDKTIRKQIVIQH